MNKQKKANGGRGIEWTDYTHNPIKGCFHACQWSMPDGSIANCYAEDIADRVAQRAYPHGFEHDYWEPETLGDPLRVKTPSRIFLGSMADVFGHWVSDDHIQQVLASVEAAHWHTFQLLTKNPRRAATFNLPANVWLGASLPPDYMWNKPLSMPQKARMLRVTLEALEASNAAIKWMSLEPLSWDCSSLIEQYGLLDWAVIGAASNGPRHYPPDAETFTRVLAALDRAGTAVFFKGNLDVLPVARAGWREDFPSLSDAAEKRAG